MWPTGNWNRARHTSNCLSLECWTIGCSVASCPEKVLIPAAVLPYIFWLHMLVKANISECYSTLYTSRFRCVFHLMHTKVRRVEDGVGHMCLMGVVVGVFNFCMCPCKTTPIKANYGRFVAKIQISEGLGQRSVVVLVKLNIILPGIASGPLNTNVGPFSADPTLHFHYM